MRAEHRDYVRNRARGRCEYCRLPSHVQLLPFHVEQIVAKQHGGNGSFANLAWACDRCNAYKGTNLSSIDPETGKVIELFHPRLDTWSEHFAIHDGAVRGLTATGRATVRLLQMNSGRRIDLRRELHNLGLLDD
jgi:hypothetical protein